MKNKSLFIASALSLTIVPLASRAQVFLSDNFDGYANQAAFEVAWPAIAGTAPTSGTLTSDQFVSPGNSIGIAGTATSGQQRNRATFADTTALTVGNILTFSFDFYDTSAAASPYRQYANLQDTTAPTGTGQLISMGMNNNHTSADSGGNYYMARILGYNPAVVDPDGGPNEGGTLSSGAYFKLNDFGVGLRSDGWHNFKVVIGTDDGLSLDFAFYVDNVLAELVSNVGTAASFRQYDNVTLGSGVSNASNGAYYDNFLVEVSPVPEPSAAALLGIGLSGLIALRRTRK